MNVFEQFLSKNSIVGPGCLPLVHTTTATHLRDFRDGNKLVATQCDVFVQDKLNYFFVGRPSYKYGSNSGEASYWECPCCFIFDFSTINDVKRIFPFDSGAFSRKKYPSYMNMMNMEAFEVSSVPDAASKIIGSFFGSPAAYFQLDAKSKNDFIREYSLGVMDHELKALHRLCLDNGAQTFDDRRFAIEVQSGSDITLSVARPLAVIAPSEYFDDAGFRVHVTDVWGAEPIPYPIFPQSIEATYGNIYERVQIFYTQRGLI